MEFTNDQIFSLKPNEVFVFGSNTRGFHKKGAALIAYQDYGAILGQARGLQGKSYAIVTKDLKRGMRSIPLENIQFEISLLFLFAKENPNLKFYVTKIGCNLAGYGVLEIAKLFYALEDKRPANVIIPKVFHRESDLFNIKK